MGAYENPVTIVDNQSGQIWANAIISLGNNVSKILDQERDRLLDENKEFSIRLRKIQEQGVKDYDFLSNALGEANITDQQIYDQAQIFQNQKTKASSILLQTGRPPEELAQAQKEFNQANQALKGLIPYIKSRGESMQDYLEQIGNNPSNVGKQGYASMTENQEFQVGTWIDTGFLKGSKEIIYDKEKGWGTKYKELDDKETGLDGKEFVIWGTQASNYTTTKVPTVDKSLANILLETGVVDKNGKLTEDYQYFDSPQTRTETSKDGTITALIVGPNWEKAAVAINDRVNQMSKGYLQDYKTANAIWRNVLGQSEDLNIVDGGGIDAEQAKEFTKLLKLRAGQYIPNVDYVPATDKKAEQWIQENPGAFERKSFKSKTTDGGGSDSKKNINIDYIDKIDFSNVLYKPEDPSSKNDKVNFDKLESIISKPPGNFITKKLDAVEGGQALTISKTVEGADRSVTIFPDSSIEDIKAQLRFLETGESSAAKNKNEEFSLYVE